MHCNGVPRGVSGYLVTANTSDFVSFERIPLLRSRGDARGHVKPLKLDVFHDSRYVTVEVAIAVNADRYV